MENSDESHLEDKRSKEVLIQERVICTVAADLLLMNKMLEDGKSKSNAAKQLPSSNSWFQRMIAQMKKMFK